MHTVHASYIACLRIYLCSSHLHDKPCREDLEAWKPTDRHAHGPIVSPTDRSIPFAHFIETQSRMPCHFLFEHVKKKSRVYLPSIIFPASCLPISRKPFFQKYQKDQKKKERARQRKKNRKRTDARSLAPLLILLYRAVLCYIALLDFVRSLGLPNISHPSQSTQQPKDH